MVDRRAEDEIVVFVEAEIGAAVKRLADAVGVDDIAAVGDNLGRGRQGDGRHTPSLASVDTSS